MIEIRETTLREANAYVEELHRHHGKVVGHKWSLAAYKDGRLCGVAIVGRPTGRYLDNGSTLEVTRLCTDGTRNACSALYAACARRAKREGYAKIITFILQSEPGTSLRAAGWTLEAAKAGKPRWNKERYAAMGESPEPEGGHDNMKKVYICSPCRGDYENNIQRAKEYSRAAVEKGVIPVTPHIYLTPPDLRSGRPHRDRRLNAVTKYDPRKNAEGYNDPTPYAAEKHMMAQIRGKQARVAGGYFENIISASCDYYLSRGLAKIEKTPEPMKPLGAKNRKGQFLACYTKQAQPDYGGTLKGGRSIYFEAKHTDDERIEQRRLTQEQQDDLEAHHQLGAIAFVLVSVSLTDFYRVPWPVWRDMAEIYGRKYMTHAELSRYEVPATAGFIKFLHGIESEVLGKEATT